MGKVAIEGSQVIEGIRGRLGAHVLDGRMVHADTVRVEIDKQAVRAAADYLFNDLRARFLITSGTDRRDLRGDYAITHIFSLDDSQLYVLLDMSIDPEDMTVDAITPIIPGAGWAEREARDAVGISPEGHPDPRRLILPDDWPDGIYPLRKDIPHDFNPPSDMSCRPQMLTPPKGASVVPIGPFFPVLEEPSYWRLFVEGETIVGCDYRGFYNPRGIEKLGDTALTYGEIPFLAERICGICGFIHSTCYCQAVEKAAGIEVPRRARYIRSLMLEMERVHSHLLWLGIAGHILGFDTVLMQSWRIREPVMWLSERISGSRKTYGMNTVGGVRRDIPEDLHPRILEVLATVEKESIAVKDAIVGDSTLLLRCKGVGILTAEQARQMCVVGPTVRGSGLPLDARADHPYAAYDEVPVRVQTQPDGDNWSRVVVRVNETLEAIRLIRECLDKMPPGPICAEITEPIPAGREGVSLVEAPRGEAIHYVLTGADNRPWRWRVRAPTYPNLQAIPLMVARETIADVPITLGSIDPCFSCTERVEAVDVKSKAVRVFNQEELVSLSREKTKRSR
jgi:Ni,Fe-hydrogenase III large subunit/Ni,Fe-hydrogenase III component G